MTKERKTKIAKFLEKGFLLSPSILEEIDDAFEPDEKTVVVCDKREKQDKTTTTETKKETNPEPTKHQTPLFEEPPSVELFSSFNLDASKKNVRDFTKYFRIKYENLRRILQNHPSLNNLTSIGHLRNNANGSEVSVIGMVADKQQTKNSVMLLIEDLTGTQRLFIGKGNTLYEDARDLVADEVIGLKGRAKTREKALAFFTKELVFPDIPKIEFKKSPVEEYMACMSDLHFGSKQFMHEAFDRFLRWVNLEIGNADQKKMAEKLKYVLIAGDIVDGVGIYQNQQDELKTLDVKKQYEECAKALSRIPNHIQIVLSPGNHDAVRMAEPQPPLDNEFAEPLTKLKNVCLVPNPATVRIGAKKNFPGFVCLLYHGYSFDYYVANVDSIRQKGGYERGDLIMEFLLKRRHIAPSHESTLIHPTRKQDALFIEHVPDFFITGHIHRTSMTNYKSTSLINSSCWQSMTSFQERLGHNPQPALLPLINLKTRKFHKIDFNE